MLFWQSFAKNNQSRPRQENFTMPLCMCHIFDMCSVILLDLLITLFSLFVCCRFSSRFSTLKVVKLSIHGQSAICEREKSWRTFLLLAIFLFFLFPLFTRCETTPKNTHKNRKHADKLNAMAAPTHRSWDFPLFLEGRMKMHGWLWMHG